MRVDAWGGLMTNASPFALPAGAAVEQVNLCADVPGQIYSRGGMRPVAFVQDSGAVLDCYPYSFDGRTFLVSLLADGSLVALESPAYGPELDHAAEPQLATSEVPMAASYTTRYIAGSADTDTPITPSPEANGFGLLYGGSATTTAWTYSLNANSLCSGQGKVSAFSCGNAATVTVPPSLTASNMCPA